MPRNLDRRVEIIVPITAPDLQTRLQEILDVNLSDDLQAWELCPDGAWAKVPTSNAVGTQQRLQALAISRGLADADATTMPRQVTV